MIEEQAGTQATVAAPAAVDAATMCEAFQYTAAARADQVALRTIADGRTLTFAEYADKTRRLAGGLHSLGVRRGDTVAFMLTNRPEFHPLDAAAMHLGATPFSVYNTNSAEQIAYLLQDAQPRVFVVEAAFYDRAREAMAVDGVGVEHVVLLDGADAEHGAIHPDELEQAGANLSAAEFDFEATWRAVQPDDVLTLIYTSGTTGPPKGVQLTHANEIAECRGVHEAAPWLGAGGATVSYLPMAHIADRGLTHYGQMFWGDTLTCCPDATQIFAHAADARPTRFGAVPRIWEKLKAALESGFETEPDEEKRGAIKGAVGAGLEKVRLEQAGESVPEELAAACEQSEAIVFKPLRARLGFDRCESYMIGAAPATLEVFEFFAAIGIPICEVWGMSEVASIATLVPQDDLRFGTVGKALPGVELKLDPDGELLVRAPTVMAGYRNQPEKTAETIDGDGWLHTGDIATIEEDGFVRIVDRKKELIINAAGKNMSPANIEQQLKQGSPLIGQAIAIGDRRPYNVALIVLDPDACGAFAAASGLADASLDAMAAERPVLDEVAAGVERANSHLSRVEQIKRFKLLGVDWPAAGDELTPTMKLKRKPINEKYAAEIEALYAS
ncbi:MAG TPA: long-chain fatty acid--CoA ligase [Solirubrobacteraceae bacterium]|nr:long-chain fatty acid--CoA ligase [Solirubrobacteraceae bacterium]